MIALYDFVPRFCPNCGTPTKLDRKATHEERMYHIEPDADFKAGASHSCLNCGLHYAQAIHHEMLKCATASNSDLHYYATR